MKKPIQLSLFSTQQNLNVEWDVKDAMHACVRESGRSRGQIVEEMNRIARRHGVALSKGNGNGISEDTLEKWLNVNAPGHFPSVKAVLIFCAVIGEKALSVLNLLVRPLGFRVIDARDARLLEWAREYQRLKETRRRMRALETEIEG